MAKLRSDLDTLPVAEALGELCAALASGDGAVLVAPPGAGKTTAVPIALLEQPWLEGRRILMLEPRRLAARAAAARMAWLLGEDGPGGTVGYRMRHDTRVSARTRIEVITEGVLPRMMQSDPGLDGVGLVIFDEFHERSLAADLGLALTLQARALLRPDLRVLVMSATLDAEPVAALLGDAPVIEARGRLFPVEIHHTDEPVEGWIEPAVAVATARALAEHEGDVLVFLPGAAEIGRTAERLAGARLPGSVDVYPLYGNLSRDDQDRAIAPSPEGRRKVVLATTIAQTSLTIEGVRVVVDGGRMRLPRFDPGTGMSRLETVRVTRDVAEQRAGRAGRLAPGVCYRLWTRSEDRGLVPRMRAEILDADLAPLALDLALWGATPDELRWLDPPPSGAYEQALELLRELEAVDQAGAATDHGRRLGEIGIHPRLGHMIERSRALRMTALACDLAALWSERDLLDRGAGSDLRLRVEALRRGRDTAGGGGHGRLGSVLREAARWRRTAGIPEGERTDTGMVGHTGLLGALAYPDRIAQRRGDERGRFLLRNGRGAMLDAADSLAGEDWIVVTDADDRGTEARVWQAAPLAAEEIEEQFGAFIESVERVEWDARAQRVVASAERRLGSLTLARAPLRDPDRAAVRKALLDGLRAAGLEALPWSRATRQLRDRLRFLHAANPEEWPDCSDEALLADLHDWLGPLVGDARRLGDLARLDLTHALMGRAGWQRRAEIDRLAPTHVEVPSGSQIAIDYSDPEAPALAARIQELFGWTETPRIGGGRMPVTIRLLSPAQRPVQVTTDLASFWRDAYFEVRKDLRGRYPKHYWPEDPLTAVARRGVRPPRE